MPVPEARIVRGGGTTEGHDDTPRPRRGLRIAVLLVLVPLIAVPLVAVVEYIAAEASRMMKQSEQDSRPAPIDPVVMLNGTALANQLREELGTTDVAIARFMKATSREKLAAVVTSGAPCPADELRTVALAMPSSKHDTTSYRVRISAPGEPIDPGSLADAAVEADHTMAKFFEAPEGWKLTALHGTARKLATIVFVVADTVQARVHTDELGVVDLFEPGSVRGVAYVYSAREHRIRCAGVIDVQNRESLKYAYTRDYVATGAREEAAQAALQGDLDTELLRAIETTLHAVD